MFAGIGALIFAHEFGCFLGNCAHLARAVFARKMRAIAEEASELVREYKGAYSGEHGDGLVRSEWIAPMFGRALRTRSRKSRQLRSQGLMNPGKIVRPSKMDDRTLFRYKPDYSAQKLDTVLDWSEWGGFDKAVEMCNNNGHCRKFDAGTMCPSYRATGEEQHLTRGRANTLRLAISGQLGAPGEDAFVSSAMDETLDLCVSCKGCKRECPTGVDMAKMKVEFLHHYRKRTPCAEATGSSPICRATRHGRRASRGSRIWAMRCRSRAAVEKLLGFSAAARCRNGGAHVCAPAGRDGRRRHRQRKSSC